MKDVLVTRALPEDILAPLRVGHRVEVWERDEPMPEAILRLRSRATHGILSMLTDVISSDLLRAATELEVVSQMAVGLDNVDLRSCAELGIRVGHTPGVLTRTVADTAMTLAGAIVRRIHEGRDVVHRGEWGPWSPFWMAGGDLHGSVMGIVGMGRVGRAVAERALGFEMEIVYTSPREVPDVPGRRLDLAELLATADVVLLAVPLNQETRGMIGADELDTMKTTAYLVNVARGPLVDSEALVEALKSGSIAGAALDVTDPEPIPPDHPLVGLGNCLITPHIGSASVKTRRAMAALAVQNLIAGLAGEPMPAEAATGV